MKKLISVILPVYNVEDYLAESIESVLNQTYKEIELIIVDDGSTDKSGEICNVYAEKYSQIKVIHTKNQGVVSARREAMKQASGEIISFIDGDDWIDPDCLLEMMESMDREDADIVICGHIVEDPDQGTSINYNSIPEGCYEKYQEDFVNKMLYFGGFYNFGIQPFLWNKLFKKSLIEKLIVELNNKIYIGEDVAVLFPALLKADRVCVERKAFYHYRMRNNSVCHSVRSDYFENVSLLYLSLLESFKKHSVCFDKLREQLDEYMKLMVWNASPYNIGLQNEFLFPFDSIPKNSRIALYGAGKAGVAFKEQIERLDFCKIVTWVDKNYEMKKNIGVVSLKEAINEKVDYWVIAVSKKRIVSEIREELINNGIDSLIIWDMFDLGIQKEKSNNGSSINCNTGF